MARKLGRKKGGKNGTGYIVKRGNNFFARWVVNGKVYTKTTGTSNRREAEKVLADLVSPFVQHDEIETLQRHATKVQGIQAELKAYEDAQPALGINAAWTAYLKSTNRPDTGEATLRQYGFQFGKLQDWLTTHHPEVKELRHISKPIADEFAAHIGGKLSANSYNKYIALFKCVWKVLADTAKLTSNPWENIRRKVQIGHTRRELTVEELSKVCAEVSGEMRLLFAIGIYSGLRLGDCALLDWGAIDLVRGIVSVIPRKTARHSDGQPVKIPMHKTLSAMLAETPTAKRRGYVLPATAKLYKRNSSELSNRISRIFQKCGIKTQAEKQAGQHHARVDVGFHSLRHTYVSLCANAGVPLALVQSIVGHSNPMMTLHYHHASEDALKTAVAALPDVTGETTQPDDADAAEARFRRFCEIWDALASDAERERAREYISKPPCQ